MAPIVYIDRSSVVPGREAELRAAFDELVALVAAEEPRIIAYVASFSPDGRRVTVVHVHPDEASLAHHFAVVRSVLPRFADLLRLESIEVHGDIGSALRLELEAKLALLGAGAATVHRPGSAWIAPPAT